MSDAAAVRREDRIFQDGSGGAAVILAMIVVGCLVGLVNGLVFVVGPVPDPFIMP